MKVFHFNTYDRGGAAIAVKRIINATLPFNPDMRLYSILPAKPNSLSRQMHAFKTRSGLDKVVNYLRWRRHYSRIRKYEKGHSTRFAKFSVIRLPVNTPLPIDEGMPDIVHLHWIAEMLDYPSFFTSIPKGTPVIWTVHDANPYTGGCHVHLDCKKYTNTCGHCPQIKSDKERDISTEIQVEKVRLFENIDLHIVANSYWIEEQARQSKVFAKAKSFQTIHNPIDAVNDFVPLDKAMCKQMLGVPQDHKVIAFGAAEIHLRHKGLGLFYTAVKELNKHRKDLTCLIFGNEEEQETDSDMPPVIYTGFLTSPRLQSVVYSAADVFVIPSLQEPFGQTVVEAMACGTPVVGFNSAGLLDTIIDGQTGLLAMVGDAKDLGEKIAQMLDDDMARATMGRNARIFASENFTPESRGRMYSELYAKVLG